jgi:hypothetical protein
VTFLREGAKAFDARAGGEAKGCAQALSSAAKPSRPNRGVPDCGGALYGSDFCRRCLEFAIVTCWGLGQH